MQPPGARPCPQVCVCAGGGCMRRHRSAGDRSGFTVFPSLPCTFRRVYARSSRPLPATRAPSAHACTHARVRGARCCKRGAARAWIWTSSFLTPCLHDKHAHAAVGRPQTISRVLDGGGIRFVEMLFRCNIFALVGAVSRPPVLLRACALCLYGRDNMMYDVCVCVCLYVFMCVCVHIYTYTSIHTHTRTQIHAHTTQSYICTRTTYIHGCTHAYTHICMHTHVHTSIPTHTHSHTPALTPPLSPTVAHDNTRFQPNKVIIWHDHTHTVLLNIFTYTYMHACMHTYIHTQVHAITRDFNPIR